MKKLLKSIGLSLIFIFLVATSSWGVRAATENEKVEYAPGEVIVGLKEINSEVEKTIKSRGGFKIKKILALKALVVKVPTGEEDIFIKNVHNIPGFRYAERNGRVRLVNTFNALTQTVQPQYTPSDPGWYYQWNMRIIEADDAWNIHKGSTGIVIAVVDTGVDYNHVDLKAHYVSGGYDWVNKDLDPWDDNGHGTHCSGIAAAVMDNNHGVAGVAQCSIWSEKVLDEYGFGFWDDVAEGIIHATDGGVDIISMSLGGYVYSSLVDSACSYAWSRGVLLVAAAGNANRNMDVFPHYPASYKTVMAISGTDSSDDRYSMSNYGSDIDVAAPGVSVPSTIPGNSYTYKTGTSMSTPHVAGIAALTLSYNPTLTNVQLREQIHNAVDDLGAQGWDPYFGYGRINAYKALTAAPKFEYSFRLNPFIDIIRFNLNPGGWINGICEAPGYTIPVLGKYEGGYAYFACDLDDDLGPMVMSFFYIRPSTMDGYHYMIRDDLALVGPTHVWATLVAGESEGPAQSEAADSGVTPAAMYTMTLNPFGDVYHLSDGISPWIWGWSDPGVRPILGYIQGNRFYLASDFSDDGFLYELSFKAGNTSTRDGDSIRTIDGYSFVGPYYFWFTLSNSKETTTITPEWE